MARLRLRDASLGGETPVLGVQTGRTVWSTIWSRGCCRGSADCASRGARAAFRDLVYAAVFSVEGVGLWMQKRWAEWVTTVITASLIPLELWELIHHPSIGAVLVLFANILIAGYLYWHVSTHQRPAPPLKSTMK